MLPVNGNVNAMPRKISCKLDIGNSSITDVKLLNYSTDWSGEISIGQVISACITATIPTPGFNLTGANVSHSMGISVNASPVEWVKIGEFLVEENSVRSKQGYTSFSAYDRLYTNTINTYQSALSYPTSLQAILNEVCSQIGITSASLGVSFTVSEDILSGYTLRDVLGFIAAMVGKNAYLSPNGALELRWFTASGYTADGTRANIPYIGESDCTVNRLICNAEDGTLISGNGGQGIYFTCPLMTQDWLDWLQGQLSGFTYRKAEIDIPFGNFCLQSGDIITVTTTGSSLTVPIMSNSWTYDGGLSSDVTAYGVSDYTGTANNAPTFISSQRVQKILETKRTKKREQQQYTSLQGEIQHAAELITGATGGYIKLEFGGNGKTAQLLVMDEPSIEQSLNVWVFNQNGLGHMGRASTSVPFDWTDVNLALTKEGTIVAERIAGNKISGVAIETFFRASSGTQPHITIKDGVYTIDRANVDSSGDLIGNPETVGKMEFQNKENQSDYDRFAVKVKPGVAFTLGTISQTSNPDNPEFFYFPDMSQAPSGASKWQIYGGDVKILGNNLIVTGQSKGDVLFGDSGSDSLRALKATVDNLVTSVNGIQAAIDDPNKGLDALDRRVTDLGG